MSRRQPHRAEHHQTSKNQHRSAKQTGPQHQLSPEMRQQEMIANLNRQNIHQYLRGLDVSSDTEQMAGRITKFSAEKIAHGLKNGAIEIARNPPPLPEKTTNPSKLSSQEQKELESRARRENMAKKIEYLSDQIRGQTPKEVDREGNLQVDFKDVLTREEHQRKMKEILQGKAEQRRRLQQLQEQQAKRHKEEEQKKQAMRLLQQQKQKQAKRLKIQEKISHRKEEHHRFIELGQQLQKEVAKVKQNTKLYQEMEKRYQSQILLPSLEEKKNKLKEIRDFHRRYDVETIKEHEKQYLQRSQEKSQEKREKSPQEWKYQPPSRSQRLSKLLKNEELQIKQHLESRRKKLQEMQKRQELYKLELKEKHKPKIDDDKKKEIEIRLIQQQRKYQKMHPNLDQRRIGEGYLEIAKKMKRAESVRDSKQQQNQRQLQQKEKQAKLSSSKVNHSQQFYQGLRRKKMEGILHSDSRTTSEKYMMLKMETQKLGEKLRQKEELVRHQPSQQAQNEAAQLLLSSITAKMGMMDLMRKQVDSEDSS